MDEGKIGGYEAKLTPRARRLQEHEAAYEKEFSNAEAKLQPENVQFVERVLSSFDMKVLKDIFLEELRKSGVPLENGNTTLSGEILAVPIEKAVAAYATFTNRIVLSTSAEDFLEAKQLVSRGRDVPEPLFLKMRLSLIHEMCHAFSRIRISSKDISNARSVVREESGYRVSENVVTQSMRPEKIGHSKKTLSFLDAFNEGVTERIAEEVFLEYEKRLGRSGQVEHFMAHFVQHNAEDLWRYSIYMSQVDDMCARIATYTGVPKDEVWKSFKRGYFEKPELFHEETIELFKETFGDDFLSNYKEFGNNTDTFTLGEFNGIHGFSHPAKYAEKWLRHLGISRE